MTSKLLQLSLYVVAVIQLTSSQSTYDVIQQDNDVKSCVNTKEMLSQLMTAVSESLKYDVNSRERSERMFSQLMTAVSQLQQNVSQLQQSDANSSSRTDQVLKQLKTSASQLQHNDVSSSSRTDQELNQPMTSASQQHQNDVNSSSCTDHMLNQLMAVVSHLNKTTSQLQRDVAEMKAAIPGCRCPSSFTHVLSVNSCYKVVTSKGNWTNAGLRCRSEHPDAHLLVINDGDEQLAVAGMLASRETALSSCRYNSDWGHQFWTAGHRSTTNSTFVWRATSPGTNADVVSSMTYTSWYPGEPNAVGNNVCMELSSAKNYRWCDLECTAVRCLVCELDL